jgi:hypothetical protein
MSIECTHNSSERSASMWPNSDEILDRILCENKGHNSTDFSGSIVIPIRHYI